MSLVEAYNNAVHGWKLDETSGTRVDSIGSMDLTDNNTVTSATGKFSNAAQFTAANSEYLSHADDASLDIGDISFAFRCWVYFDDLTSNREIVNKDKPSTNERSYRLFYAQSSDHIRIGCSSDGNSGATQNAIGTLSGISVDTWYLVWGWFNKDEGSLNIVKASDGVVDPVRSTAHTGGSFSNTVPFIMGNTQASAYMDGRIDDFVFIKNWYPSFSDIVRDYNNGTGIAFADWPNTPSVRRLVNGGLVNTNLINGGLVR